MIHDAPLEGTQLHPGPPQLDWGELSRGTPPANRLPPLQQNPGDQDDSVPCYLHLLLRLHSPMPQLAKSISNAGGKLGL
ncbi:hypothetical protein PGT21_010025 [Puccinia graminis f. sp. tritici]|uniref:Uncharacterized protein n=1 Tax=Puccinia graminis f. sp. tritici TaxID=56615 RepID=A0A5B0QSR8_PUCGR|nr:hypothetical protein PGT21_010025 [Puccinia graminis f. sp. tritici]